MWNNTGGFGGDFDGGYSGQDGGAAAAGGGGFMNSPGQFNSPGAGAKKERRNQNLIATSIKTILDCQEDPFMIEDLEVHMVVIVGIVRSVEITSTKISYSIDDHTGIIDVLRYPDGDSDDNSQPDALAEGVYARVYGPVRSHQEKKHIIGFKVAQVEDPNMVTTHLLEVLHQKMKIKKLMEADQGAAGGVGSVLPNSSLRSGPEVPGKTGGSDRDMVYAAIKSSTSDVGMSKTMMITVLRGKLSAEKIEKVVEELAAEGAIYTTHDDDHFMVIES